MSKSGAMANVTTPLPQTPSPSYNSIQYGKSPEEKEDSSNTHSETSSYKQPSYQLYRWRWFMLFSLCFLNISNGMMWLTYAPIPSFTAGYYNVPVSSVDWFSMVYFAVSLVVGFISIFVLNKWGLKVSVYAGAIFNVCGSLLRIVSTAEPVICSSVFASSGYMVAMLGQALTACAQPFLLYAPTTLASIWFGPKERAVASGLSSLANPVGLAVVQLTSPYIVTSVSRLPMMLWIYTIPAVAGLLLNLVAFWYKEPPSPPTPSADREHVLSFINGFKKIICIPSFLLLMVVWGCAAGLFNALLTILPQVLCPYGYTNKETGLWGSLMIFSGMLGAFLAGLIIDYTKAFKEVAVVSYSFAILSFIWFFEVSSIQHQGVLIALSLCVFGFFGLPMIPACMELGVEITYPVAEVTSSGLLWSGAQVMGIMIVLIGQAIQTPIAPDLIAINQCGDSTNMNGTSLPKCFQPSHNDSIPTVIKKATDLYESSNTILFCMALTAANFLVLVLCFWPKYKRIEAEKRSSFEKSVMVK